MRAGKTNAGNGAVVLAAVVLLSALPGAAQAAKRVALVIGNSAYEHTDVLRNPGNDADAMAKALKRLGFEVEKGTDLDRDGFYQMLGEFRKATREAEVALFFYAGHGVQVHEKNWLVPVDAEFKEEWHLEQRGVPLDTVMDRMHGEFNLVFLDACRNNPLAGELAGARGKNRDVAANRGLARLKGERGSGWFIGYATARGELAEDGAGRNSPFTAGLLKHIETPGQAVPVMYGRASGFVEVATGGAQEPWQYSSLRGEPLYLAGGPPPDGTETVGGTTPPPPPPPPPDAARAYEQAVAVGTVGAFQSFIEHFPDIFQAGLARDQIAKLEAYGAAERENTVAAFREFIRRFRGSDEAKRAREHIARLEAKRDEDEVVSPPSPTPAEVEESLGLSREAKRQVQIGLALAGHDPGPADGEIGGGTREALRGWQRGEGFEVTGYLTREQSEALVRMGRAEGERRRVEAQRKAREEEARRVAEAKRREQEAVKRLRAGVRHVALVIGNRDYEHLASLINTINDARAMGDAFERLGYAVTWVENADRRLMFQALEEFKRRADHTSTLYRGLSKPNPRDRAASGLDVAVVFYSGHGHEVDGSTFLLPVDAQLARYDDAKHEGVSLYDFIEAVEAARLGLVVVDASGATYLEPDPQLEGSEGGSMVAFSSSPGGTEPSDGPAGGNSPYTETLVKYLKEAPGLDVRELFEQVGSEVYGVSATKQLPTFYASLGESDIYLAPDPLVAEGEGRRRLAREPGTKFRDCPECPEMVVVPGGTIGRPFAVGVYEVRLDEWDACVSGGGCGGYRPPDMDKDWVRGSHPVYNVLWKEAKSYVEWLSRKTGEEYRLLSESEWEYVARAGTTTRYWWGNEVGRNRANCNGCGSRWDDRQTAPVGSFEANAFGLYDVHGNVSEWVEHGRERNTVHRGLRGGSYQTLPRFLGFDTTAYDGTRYRDYKVGFRVARTLTP